MSLLLIRFKLLILSVNAVAFESALSLYFKAAGRKSKARNAKSVERTGKKRFCNEIYKHKFTTINTSISRPIMSIGVRSIFLKTAIFGCFVYVESLPYVYNSRSAKTHLKTRVYYVMILLTKTGAEPELPKKGERIW